MTDNQAVPFTISGRAIRFAQLKDGQWWVTDAGGTIDESRGVMLNHAFRRLWMNIDQSMLMQTVEGIGLNYTYTRSNWGSLGSMLGGIPHIPHMDVRAQRNLLPFASQLQRSLGRDFRTHQERISFEVHCLYVYVNDFVSAPAARVHVPAALMPSRMYVLSPQMDSWLFDGDTSAGEFIKEWVTVSQVIELFPEGADMPTTTSNLFHYLLENVRNPGIGPYLLIKNMGHEVELGDHVIPADGVALVVPLSDFDPRFGAVKPVVIGMHKTDYNVEDWNNKLGRPDWIAIGFAYQNPQESQTLFELNWGTPLFWKHVSDELNVRGDVYEVYVDAGTLHHIMRSMEPLAPANTFDSDIDYAQAAEDQIKVSANKFVEFCKSIGASSIHIDTAQNPDCITAVFKALDDTEYQPGEPGEGVDELVWVRDAALAASQRSAITASLVPRTPTPFGGASAAPGGTPIPDKALIEALDASRILAAYENTSNDPWYVAIIVNDGKQIKPMISAIRELPVRPTGIALSKEDIQTIEFDDAAETIQAFLSRPDEFGAAETKEADLTKCYMFTPHGEYCGRTIPPGGQLLLCPVDPPAKWVTAAALEVAKSAVKTADQVYTKALEDIERAERSIGATRIQSLMRRLKAHDMLIHAMRIRDAARARARACASAASAASSASAASAAAAETRAAASAASATRVAKTEAFLAETAAFLAADAEAEEARMRRRAALTARLAAIKKR